MVREWTKVPEIPVGCLFHAVEDVSTTRMLEKYVAKGIMTEEQAEEAKKVYVKCQVVDRAAVNVIGSWKPVDRLRQPWGDDDHHEVAFWNNLVDALEPAEDSLEGLLFTEDIENHMVVEVIQELLATNTIRLTDVAKAWGRIEARWEAEE